MQIFLKCKVQADSCWVAKIFPPFSSCCLRFLLSDPAKFYDRRSDKEVRVMQRFILRSVGLFFSFYSELQANNIPETKRYISPLPCTNKFALAIWNGKTKKRRCKHCRSIIFGSLMQDFIGCVFFTLHSSAQMGPLLTQLISTWVTAGRYLLPNWKTDTQDSVFRTSLIGRLCRIPSQKARRRNTYFVLFCNVQETN